MTARRRTRAAGGRRYRLCALAAVWAMATGACSAPPSEAPPAEANVPPHDAEHAGVTEPHGDHTPHRGGLVLMNGDLHYEVVLDPGGRHQVWFSSATREDLPASIAADVVMVVSRPGAPPERLDLVIDQAGEAWVARGQPLAGPDAMVKVTYTVRGVPHEVEIPYR
ncbi:MAG: hypothetical protein AB1635_21520 [Acidobacteriota bacterium]